MEGIILKNGKVPTAKQREIIRKNKMEPQDWLVSKVEPKSLLCTHRHTNTQKRAFYEVPSLC